MRYTERHRREDNSFGQNAWRLVASAVLLVGVLPAGAMAQVSVTTTKPVVVASDAQAAEAMRRGLAWLYSRQSVSGAFPSRYSGEHPGGAESLVLWAALSCGQKIDSPVLGKSLKYVESLQPQTVYARSVRAMVYARLGKAYAGKLAADVDWLAREQTKFGGWGYGSGHSITQQRPDWTDNSNTALAALALREAERAGAAAPRTTWARLAAIWFRAQNPDGGWGYTPPTEGSLRLKASSYGSMTASGLTTCCILSEELGDKAAEINGKGAAAVAQALAWLEKNHETGVNPQWVWGEEEDWAGVYLYYLSGAMQAAGLRNLGKHDLPGEVLGWLVQAQKADGSWAPPGGATAANGLDIVRTCFSLLAISQVRRPVLLNRMVLASPGAADPCWREGANLADWYSSLGGVEVTWQAVAPDAPLAVLCEAPILYVVAPAGSKLAGELGKTLREYVRGGGLLLVRWADGDAEFAAQAKASLADMLGMSAAELAAGHPAFNASFGVPADLRPALTGFVSGVRTGAVLLPASVGAVWQAGPAAKNAAPLFEMFGNMVRLATDDEPLPARLASRQAVHAAAATSKPTSTIRIARVVHSADWDACPQAMARLDEVLTEAMSIGVEEVRWPGKTAELLWMTGETPPKLSADAMTKLEDALLGGASPAMLFIDSAGGGEEFYRAAVAMLQEMFGSGSVRPLPADHPLLTGKFAGGAGADCTRAKFSRALVAAQPALSAPVLSGVTVDGRLVAVISRYGVTCPLEGLPAYGAMTLVRDDARRLAANIALFAAAQAGR